MTLHRDFAQSLATHIPDAGTAIAVAVSGGPDSLGLLLLAHAARPGRIHAATVDHGLRPESAGEATMVAALCAARDIPHSVLRADWHPATGRGLQAAARAHRYALLDGWCRAAGIGWLLTAHHRDDQAETLVLRLARGAGLTGLAGVRTVRPLLPASPVTLLRPLLATAKSELVAFVVAAGIDPVDDPANRDPRHDRTHARTLLASTPWLDPARLAATAGHLAAAETALAWATDREAAGRIAVMADGTRLLDPAGLPHDIVRRLVARCLQPGDAPRGNALDRLIARLAAGRAATLCTTLAQTTPAGWTFRPAPPRRPTRNP